MYTEYIFINIIYSVIYQTCSPLFLINIYLTKLFKIRFLEFLNIHSTIFWNIWDLLCIKRYIFQIKIYEEQSKSSRTFCITQYYLHIWQSSPSMILVRTHTCSSVSAIVGSSGGICCLECLEESMSHFLGSLLSWQNVSLWASVWIWGITKKSQGARSGEYGGCGTIGMLLLARNCCTTKADTLHHRTVECSDIAEQVQTSTDVHRPSTVPTR